MACPENWYPVYYYDPQKNSLGYCKECPPGTYLEVLKVSQVPPKDPVTGEWLVQPKQPKCVPLDCRGGIDPKHPHACLPPREAKPAIPRGPVPRACPRGMRRVGNACVPPTSTLVPRTRLACPPGTVPNTTRTSCIAIGRIRPDARAVPRGPAGLRLPTAPTLRAVPTPRAPDSPIDATALRNKVWQMTNDRIPHLRQAVLASALLAAVGVVVLGTAFSQTQTRPQQRQLKLIKAGDACERKTDTARGIVKVDACGRWYCGRANVKDIIEVRPRYAEEVGCTWRLEDSRCKCRRGPAPGKAG